MSPGTGPVAGTGIGPDAHAHANADVGDSGQVEYEVNLSVAAGIVQEYLAWLEDHVRQLLALPGFLAATLWRVEDPASESRVAYCVRYRLTDAQALASYLREHAPAMRQAGSDRFGEHVVASRRILRACGPTRRPRPGDAVPAGPGVPD